MKVLGEKGEHMAAHALISFLGGSLSASIFFVFFMSLSHGFVSTPIATVDMTSLIDHFVKTESARTASLAQHHAQVHVFSQQLDSALQRIAQEKHVILVPKEAVVAGQIMDVTSEVTQRLEKTLQPISSVPAQSEQ